MSEYVRPNFAVVFGGGDAAARWSPATLIGDAVQITLHDVEVIAQLLDPRSTALPIAPPAQAPMAGAPQIIDRTPLLQAPLLGLFGAEDQTPSPAQVAELEQALKDNGKTYEFHSYEGAGHGFFAADRPSYRAEAAADGRQRILAWLGRYLAA